MNHPHGLLVAFALTLGGCSGADFNGADNSGRHASEESAHARHADGDSSRVLGSVDIGAGEHAGDVSTVNGAIRIGENAVVGHVDTVNGGITVDAHATAGAVETVNGGIRINDGAGISGHVETVNGSLNIATGADVKGDLSNINGAIAVAAAHIGGNISTVTGDLRIGPDAHVDGGIHVQKNNSWFQLGSSVPRVVIAPGSVVKGALRFDRKVLLYVSDRAIIGEVQGATVNKFSGDAPSS
ncbi:MAG: hypothetical protein PVSMB6_13250 [Steroidobacteraceae bacterium]